ncbi:LON peptidase substrate-binding domain-containing protein [Streptomyces sp. SID3343]|uniref:LON peptidase substrate-binding domain-containing protein n=1 Tax=Streptomyces sp. SID3343 TaxID=2690260 RepID=UPI00136A4620|nr:LON peptidase substrate-binding domain-containing protein [Streptomyces sp. SID3343]MYW03942.1 peptidase S16 [Streptomyces sp. SID3343]
MVTVTDRLPLFPLDSVLYPGLVLPLHVFEERYRALVGDLEVLPQGEQRFGVVALRTGREVGDLAGDPLDVLYPVGCTAEVATIKSHEDGRYDLVATGATRFRVVSVDDSGPYLYAEVEYLDDPVGDRADVLALAATRAFAEYQRRLLSAQQRTPISLPELPDDPVVLSYLVAAAVVLDSHDKQRLLEAETAGERLTAEIELLRLEAALLDHLPSLPAVDLLRQNIELN